jgi:hypothetical protein
VSSDGPGCARLNHMGGIPAVVLEKALASVKSSKDLILEGA